MKRLIFVISVILLFIGCNKQVEVPIVEPSDNVSESKIIQWPEKERHFQITMYFSRMANNPVVRMRYQPIQLYGICVCIIDKFESNYEYDKFLKYFSGKFLTPDKKREVYDVSLKCSTDTMDKLLKSMQNQMMTKQEPEDHT